MLGAAPADDEISCNCLPRHASLPGPGLVSLASTVVKDMNRSWIWMAVFCIIFLGIGIAELTQGQTTYGAGYLLCGGGAALVTVAQRRPAESKSARWLSVVGSVGMAIGIVLLALHLVG